MDDAIPDARMKCSARRTSDLILVVFYNVCLPGHQNFMVAKIERSHHFADIHILLEVEDDDVCKSLLGSEYLRRQQLGRQRFKPHNSVELVLVTIFC